MSNIVKGSGLLYTTGVPNTIPSTAHDSEFAIDINGNHYAWNRTTTKWDNLGQGIEIATSSIAPTHVPTKFRPRFVITPQRKLYFYSGSWGLVNAPDGQYTAIESYYPSLAVDVGSSGDAPTYYIYLNPNGATDGQALVWSDADGDWVPGTVGGSSGPTGIYSGSGTVPDGTIATVANNFRFDYSSSIYTALKITDNDEVKLTSPDGMYIFTLSTRGASFTDQNVDPVGLVYPSDYSTTIKENDRSIPDVGTVKQIARPYKVYTALLTQSGTDDPVATVLENTLSGTPVWTRDDVGLYACTLASEFTENKTSIICGQVMKDDYELSANYQLVYNLNSTSIINFATWSRADIGSVDGTLSNALVEIRVYP